MILFYNEAHALKLLGQGNKKGFKMLYQRYSVGIARIALKFLQSSELAEDLVQEVFTQVWVEREKFSRVDNFQSYLFICTKNRALYYLKKIANEEAAKREYLSLKAIASNSIDEYIGDKELAGLVQQAVDALPTQCRRVYLMAKEEGLSYKDIAEQLQLTPLTVKTHVYHATKFIRERLSRHIAAAIYLGAFLAHRTFAWFHF